MLLPADSAAAAAAALAAAAAGSAASSALVPAPAWAASPQLLLTADGSPTLYLAALEETYHSTRGAEQESAHVYIRAGLAEALRSLRTRRPAAESPLRLLEMGFGTGLNALLTWEWLAAHPTPPPWHYEALELHPLPATLAAAYGAALPATDEQRPARLAALHHAEWEKTVALAPFFALRKRHLDLVTAALPGGQYDLIYYDAFAPSRQPALWTDGVLARVAHALAPGGILVTYCATGASKRAWRAAGLHVESLPGAPGKRQMTRARRPW